MNLTGGQSLPVSDIFLGSPLTFSQYWPVFTFIYLANDSGRAIRHHVHVGDTGDWDVELAILVRVFALKDPCVAAQTYTANVDDRNAMVGEIAAKDLRHRRQEDVFCISFDDHHTASK